MCKSREYFRFLLFQIAGTLSERAFVPEIIHSESMPNAQETKDGFN